MRTTPALGTAVIAFAATAVAYAGCGGSVQSTPNRDAATDTSSGATAANVPRDGGGSGSVGSASDASAYGQPAPSGARCGPTPTHLVDFAVLADQMEGVGISAGQPLAIDATRLYFVIGYTLVAIPIGGGSPSLMAQLPDSDPRLSQGIQPFPTSTNIVLHYTPASSTDEEIVAVPIQGGTPAVLTTTHGRMAGFAASGSDVYFIDSDGAKTIPGSGGPVTLLTSQVAGASGLAVVGSRIVVTEESGTVVGFPLAGGPPTTLATQQPNARFPLACGADVCWWTGATPNPLVAGEPGVGASGPGAIARLDASGNVTTLPGAPTFPWSLAFDGSSFFETVGCDLCSGTLMRVPLAGAPATMLTAGFVAVDDECAYFSTTDVYPAASNGSQRGIYSVSKDFTSCCDAADHCVYTTGSCPAAADGGSD